MYRFLPLLLSALLTGVIACMIGWRQNDQISQLRAAAAARVVATAKPPESTPIDKPPVKEDLLPDGLPHTYSLSPMRIGQEFLEHYRTRSSGDLAAALKRVAIGGASLEAAVNFLMILSVMIEKDLPGTVAAVEKMSGDTRLMATTLLLNDWLLRDRKAALAWYARTPREPKQNDVVMVSATMLYGGFDPGLVKALKSGISEEEKLPEYTEQTLRALALTDPESALLRLEEITEPGVREQIRMAALRELAGKKPEVALSQLLVPGATQESSLADAEINQVFGRYLQADQSAAMKWCAAQPRADQERIARAIHASPGFLQALEAMKK